MKLLLATPTYGALSAEYASSMMRLQAALQQKGLPSRSAFNSMAEVARSRNTLATHFWENPDLTHLLFVDSDMSFDPEAVGALIGAGRPLVGAVYPKRQISLDRLVEAARKYPDTRSAITAALDWVVVPGSGDAQVENGLCKVDGVGMGLCLIAREVLVQLFETGRISQDRRPQPTTLIRGPLLGFFDAMDSDQGAIPEDLAFCKRWREWCGGDVWALLDQDIGHVGTMVYRGRCLDALQLAGG